MTIAAPRLYFENAVGRLSGHPDGYALIQFHPGPRTLSALQTLLTQVRRVLELHRWHRFLNDQRLLAHPYNPEEAAWIVEHWHNTAAEHPEGLYGAVVMSHNVFTRIVMGQIVQEANTAATMHFRRFEAEAEAEAEATAWLQQVG